MHATFSLSRATKAQLQQRVRDLSRAYNEMAREANGICDPTVPFRAEWDIKKGETLMIRFPRRFIVRNR